MDSSQDGKTGEGPKRRPDGTLLPGYTANKKGGKRLDPDVKAMLVDATPDRIRRLEKLSRDAEDAGDLKTAAHIEISLLKKTVPDTTELLVGGVKGAPLQVGINIAKLTTEQLDQLAAIRRALTGD